MQLTKDKPSKVLLGKAEYVIVFVLIFCTGYVVGRGWENLRHKFSELPIWVVPGLLLLVAIQIMARRKLRSPHN